MSKEIPTDIEKRIGRDVKTDAPLISVVMPAYQTAACIAETLESVFAQTFGDYEIILVNDGSPDTPELERALAGYFDRLVYIAQPNGGAAAARNTAIAAARGEFLAFLDSDDVWLPNYLAEQLRCLRAGDFEMIYCDALMFGEKMWDGKTYMETAPSNGAVTPESLIAGDTNIITSGTVVRRENVVECGGFDENPFAAGTEDFVLWFALAKKQRRIGYQKQILLKYRVNFASLSGGSVKRAERSLRALELIRAAHDLNAAETAAWERQKKSSEAHLELEKGKLCLVEKKFDEARRHFISANDFYRKRKYQILIWLIESAPNAALNLYRKFRGDEFEFVKLGSNAAPTAGKVE